MNKDLSRLNAAEELWLWRIRQPVNDPRPGKYRHGCMTRAEAAKFLGMSLERYKNLEIGKRINIAVDELPSLAFLRMPRPEMSLREQLLLARRRSGRYIRVIAEDYGHSHTSLLTHEEMASRRLIDYWIAKGFFGWNLPEEVVVRPAQPARPPRPRLQPRPPVPPVPPVVIEQPPPVVRPRPTLLRRGVVVPPPPPPRPTRPVLLRRSA